LTIQEAIRNFFQRRNQYGDDAAFCLLIRKVGDQYMFGATEVSEELLRFASEEKVDALILSDLKLAMLQAKEKRNVRNDVI
jgi:hypothetical protein